MRPDMGGAGSPHLRIAALGRARMPVDGIEAEVLVDLAESPLGWLARRRGRDGRPLIDAAQFAAGERLRIDFTRAGMTPRLTADWSAPRRQRGAAPRQSFPEAVLAAKERLSRALDAVGPEFSGLLLDVCCFLKGVEQVEGERGWPARSGKIVLGLALDRLARHYGLDAQARGRSGGTRTWIAPGERARVDGLEASGGSAGEG